VDIDAFLVIFLEPAAMKSPVLSMSLLVLAASFPLVSCGTLKSVGQSSVAAVKKTGSATASMVKAIPSPKMPKMSMPELPDMGLANLMPGRRIKVVEVREKDLQDFKTGKELAQTYKRERTFWIFGGPVDFKEPTLPEPGTEMDGGLLPPRMP
jgi:hypothetical protein